MKQLKMQITDKVNQKELVIQTCKCSYWLIYSDVTQFYYIITWIIFLSTCKLDTKTKMNYIFSTTFLDKNIWTVYKENVVGSRRITVCHPKVRDIYDRVIRISSEVSWCMHRIFFKKFWIPFQNKIHVQHQCFLGTCTYSLTWNKWKFKMY